MTARPRLGFLGVGWIGRHRMAAIERDGSADIVAIADPSRERREAALAIAPAATTCEHLGQLLEQPLDGVVIATPSALHAEHCLAALARGCAVFCQKPLGRTAAEAARVVAAARGANCLLGVDLSYRYTAAIQRIREVLRGGGIGRASIYALPARYEPFGLSVLEAALAGCALVLGDLPTLREVWGDTAVYVPPGDPDALGFALNALIRNPLARVGHVASSRARALGLSPARVAAAYHALYNETIARRQARPEASP